MISLQAAAERLLSHGRRVEFYELDDDRDFMRTRSFAEMSRTERARMIKFFLGEPGLRAIVHAIVRALRFIGRRLLSVVTISPRRRIRMARSACSPHSPPDDPAPSSVTVSQAVTAQRRGVLPSPNFSKVQVLLRGTSPLPRARGVFRTTGTRGFLLLASRSFFSLEAV